MSFKTTWYGDKAKAAMKRGAVKGLTEWADDVLKASQQQVPVSPYARGGFLKSTGESSVDEGGLQAAVSYDTGKNIAIYVHERMEVSHRTGKAKFLEDPLNESKTSGPAKVQQAIKRELG